MQGTKKRELITDKELLRVILHCLRDWYQSGWNDVQIGKFILRHLKIHPDEYWVYWERYKEKYSIKIASKRSIKPVCYLCGVRLRYNDTTEVVLDWRKKQRRAHQICVRLNSLYY